ncbi:MAG: hypothetical protein L0154_29790 [Chloroflexi bacterium]|nr:hypothetical protein [Chloroflexota bacterium]
MKTLKQFISITSLLFLFGTISTQVAEVSNRFQPAMKWSADGQLFGVATENQVCLYQLESANTLLPVAQFSTHSPAWQLDFDGVHNRVVMGHEDGTLSFWDIDGRSHSLFFIHDITDPIMYLSVDEQDNMFIFGAYEKDLLEVRQLDTLSLVHTLRISGGITSMTIDVDRDWLILGRANTMSDFPVWNYKTNELVREIPTPRALLDIGDVELSHDATILVVSHSLPKLLIIDLRSDEEVTDHEISAEVGIIDSTINHNNTLLAVKSIVVEIWTLVVNQNSILIGDNIFSFPEGTSVLFHPSKNLIISNSDKSIKLWDTTTFELLYETLCSE